MPPSRSEESDTVSLESTLLDTEPTSQLETPISSPQQAPSRSHNHLELSMLQGAAISFDLIVTTSTHHPQCKNTPPSSPSWWVEARIQTAWKDPLAGCSIGTWTNKMALDHPHSSPSGPERRVISIKLPFTTVSALVLPAQQDGAGKNGLVL